MKNFKQFSELNLGNEFIFYIFKRGYIHFIKADYNYAIEKDNPRFGYGFSANDLVEIV